MDKRMNRAVVTCLAVLMALTGGVSLPVSAEIFKCDIDGKMVFQQMPCKQGIQEVLDKTEGVDGLHGSWFKRPEMLRSSVRCNDVACTCGDKNVEYNEDEAINLLNAMSGLISGWKSHRYAMSTYRKHSSKGKRYSGTVDSVKGAACRIAIYQKIVKEDYALVSETIIAAHELNSSGLKAIKETCKKPDETGWTNSQEAKDYVLCKDKNRKANNLAVKMNRKTRGLYNMLMQDTAKLRAPRKAY
ncbi:hypothetical protein EZV61_11395 [Corallincola luteus]|uniref:DUF4124 domain-containing protein n=1 Tax=Corallincola luteus TaxID=1775177 RepID=A0ABY2AJA9_9GAMM|nr:hypothetical protein [Corallincola luteus]TCI02892.1 hypothetical protein EZV61_11395 [Corallincola luteus]